MQGSRLFKQVGLGCLKLFKQVGKVGKVRLVRKVGKIGMELVGLQM